MSALRITCRVSNGMRVRSFRYISAMIQAVSGAQGRILKVIGSGASIMSPAPPICSTPKPPSASNSGKTGVLDVSLPKLEKVSATPFCRASRKLSTLNAFPRIIPCWSL